MSKQVGVIVYASSVSEAQQCGYKLFESILCYRHRRYSGGRLLSVQDAASERGQKLLEEMMGETKRKFLANLEKIKKVTTDYSSEDVFELLEYLNRKEPGYQELEGLQKAFFECSMSTRVVNLLDNDGQALFTKVHLDKVLTEWKPKDKYAVLVIIEPFG